MNFFVKLVELFTTAEYLEMMFIGLSKTVMISICAAVLGIVLGTLVALCSLAKDKGIVMKGLKILCKIYITIIRGTPMALQLFIMVFAIFAIRGFPTIITAILAFGINSGAYVAENIRAGILSVDIGQTEAGRALGLNSKVTLLKIVIPQAIKNVIPAMGNELIALIKETSIVSMVSIKDLTWAAKNIGAGNNLASYVVPMTSAALFYLAIVYLLAYGIKLIEKRLRASDKR